MHPKLKMLKEVLRQMQCAMAEGDGDSESAGHEAMESLSEGDGEKKIAAVDKEELGGEDESLDGEKKDFMRRGKKLPTGGKGTGVVMMKMMASAKKPEGKKLKYG